jgi:choline transport protein
VVAVIVIIVTCCTRAPTFQHSHTVWAEYTNNIAWSSPFLVVATGLINPAYCFAALDGAVHLTDDSTDPARDVPLALLFAVISSVITGLGMGITLMYTLQDFADASSAYVPLLAILRQATQSQACATVFFLVSLVSWQVAGNSVLQATSRLL